MIRVRDWLDANIPAAGPSYAYQKLDGHWYVEGHWEFVDIPFSTSMDVFDAQNSIFVTINDETVIVNAVANGQDITTHSILHTYSNLSGNGFNMHGSQQSTPQEIINYISKCWQQVRMFTAVKQNATVV